MKEGSQHFYYWWPAPPTGVPPDPYWTSRYVETFCDMFRLTLPNYVPYNITYFVDRFGLARVVYEWAKEMVGKYQLFIKHFDHCLLFSN